MPFFLFKLGTNLANILKLHSIFFANYYQYEHNQRGVLTVCLFFSWHINCSLLIKL